MSASSEDASYPLLRSKDAAPSGQISEYEIQIMMSQLRWILWRETIASLDRELQYQLDLGITWEELSQYRVEVVLMNQLRLPGLDE